MNTFEVNFTFFTNSYVPEKDNVFSNEHQFMFGRSFLDGLQRPSLGEIIERDHKAAGTINYNSNQFAKEQDFEDTFCIFPVFRPVNVAQEDKLAPSSLEELSLSKHASAEPTKDCSVGFSEKDSQEKGAFLSVKNCCELTSQPEGLVPEKKKRNRKRTYICEHSHESYYAKGYCQTCYH